MKINRMGIVAVAAWLLTVGIAAAAPAPDSKHMSRAKEYIDDEQWGRAIAELHAAVADPKEANRDEALFWLAHSQHQVGDETSALQSIATLERTAPSSKWVRLGWSLRLEIARALRREDWISAWADLPAPPAPPAPPMRPGVAPRPAMPAPTAPPSPNTPVAVPPPAAPVTPPVPPTYVRGRFGKPVPPSPPAAPLPGAATPTPWPDGTEIWMPSGTATLDPMFKVQALSMLVDAHGEQAIPMLRAIALDPNGPDEAVQAVFVLAQSNRPEARRTVIDVARRGAVPVRIAAVRELGHFDDPMVSSELMQVYTTGNAPPPLKQQVVKSLGQRADNASLVRIVKLESEPNVREFAIRTLALTGARDQLRLLYPQTPQESRPAVLNALFTVKDDEELIRIAKTEPNRLLRMRARQQLRLLATPKAIKFLEDNP